MFTNQQLQAFLLRLTAKDDFVFLDCGRPGPGAGDSRLFLSPVARLSCDGRDDAAGFLRQAEEFLARGYYLAGWIAYEFGYLLEPSLRRLLHRAPSSSTPLARLGVYTRSLDPHSFLSARPGEDEGEASEIPAENGFLAHVRTNVERDDYLRAIRRIREYIVCGDTYQVNFTIKLKFKLLCSLTALYRALRFNQSVSYGAWIREGGRDIMSFSPELFFEYDSGGIRVRPMKGTLRRGRTTAEDEELRQLLGSDVKNRAENVMIVDLLRNDLGRLLHDTGGGRVQVDSLFDVETYETLLQMTSTISAYPKTGRRLGFREVMRALFPCGSVTGAPKIRTMEIIGELEREPRGVYTGAIGFVHAERAMFNVPIRTLVLENGHGEMGIGSGIVFDSDPEAEWRECLLKGDFLTRPRPDFQLIETLLWQPQSGYLLLDLHLRRLQDSAGYFLFSCDPERLRRCLAAAADECAAQKGARRVRLLLYADGEISITTAACDSLPLTDPAAPVVCEPLPRAVFSEKKVDSSSPYLFHKTTRREIYDRERQRIVELGFHEAFFVNERDEVTEGTISNIVIRKNNTWLTPPRSCGLLDGVLRRYLLERSAVPLREKILTRAEVASADEIYAVNSVRGMLRVELAT